MWNQIDVFATDVGEAVFGSQHASVWLGLGALALITVGMVVLRDRLAFSASFVVIYSLFLLAWPYSSPRFGLAFLPWAAVGAAVAVQALARKTTTAVAMGVALLLVVPYGIDARSHTAQTATTEDSQVAQLETAVDDIDTWLHNNIAPDAVVASPDYRELAYRTDRSYLPVPYTSDSDELWRLTGLSGAQYLVVLKGIYPSREKVVAELVASRPNQLVLVAETDASAIYRICADQTCP